MGSRRGERVKLPVTRSLPANWSDLHAVLLSSRDRSLSAYTRALHAPNGRIMRYILLLLLLLLYKCVFVCVCVSYKYEYANRIYKRNPHGNRTIYFNMRRDTYQKVGQFRHCPI